MTVVARRRSRRAFSLLELVVGVLVIGALGLIAVPSYQENQASSVDAMAEQTISSVTRDALAIAISEGRPRFDPADFETAMGELAADNVAAVSASAGVHAQDAPTWAIRQVVIDEALFDDRDQHATIGPYELALIDGAVDTKVSWAEVRDGVSYYVVAISPDRATARIAMIAYGRCAMAETTAGKEIVAWTRRNPGAECGAASLVAGPDGRSPFTELTDVPVPALEAAGDDANSRINLTWTISDSSTIARYDIFRRTTDDPASTFEKIDEVTGGSATSYADVRDDDSFVEFETDYTYRVVAVDSLDFESGPSNEATAQIINPVPVPELTATADPSGPAVDLAWTVEDPETMIVTFEVLRDDTVIGTRTSTQTTFRDTTVDFETDYIYTVRAVDGPGMRSLPADPVTVRVDYTQPAPALAGAVNEALVASDLSWTVADSRFVDHYLLYRDGAVLATVPAGTLTYRDSAVTLGTTYAYRVLAVDSWGQESVLSNQVDVAVVRTITDDFNRSATPMGTTSDGRAVWEPLRGTWSANGTRAVTSESQNNHPVAVVDALTANVDVSADISTGGGDAIVARVDGANTWLRARLYRWSETVQTGGGYWQTVVDQPGHYHTHDRWRYHIWYNGWCGDNYNNPGLEGSPGDHGADYQTWSYSGYPAAPTHNPCRQSGTHYGTLVYQDGTRCCTGNHSWYNAFWSGWFAVTSGNYSNGRYAEYDPWQHWHEPTYKQEWVEPTYSTYYYHRVVLESAVDVSGAAQVTQLGIHNLGTTAPSRLRLEVNGTQARVWTNRSTSAVITATVPASTATRHGISRGPSPLSGNALDNFQVAPVS